jgi:predicted enzyme related to lactoylglutathione lyase
MPGQMVHVEIPAGDTSKAREFWSGLFGWQWQEVPGPTEYHMTRFSETSGGAVYAPDPANKRGARVYFDVDDINAATAKVGELGGEAGEAMPVPGMGWFSINKDTEGNEFGLWQNDESAPEPSG